MKAKLTEKLIELGWTVEDSINKEELIVRKKVEPIAGAIMCFEMPATGTTFISYDLADGVITYLLFSREFEHLYNNFNSAKI